MFDARAIKANFSRAAASYDAHALLQKTIRANAITLAQPYIPAGSDVLDIGCGTGALAREKMDWNVVGLDMSYGMCAAAHGHMPCVINAAADGLPLADRSVENIFSCLMLQWANKPEAVIKEMLRVLKPGGKAVITTFAKGTLAELAAAFSVVDDAPHVSDFTSPPELLLRVAHMGGIMLHTNEYTEIQVFDDVLSLMKSLKHIGATNKHSQRKRGLMTPKNLARVQAAYPLENGRVQASWRVLTMIVEKP